MAKKAVTQELDEDFDPFPAEERIQSLLRILTDTWYNAQRARIRCGNQIAAAERNADSMTDKGMAILARWFKTYEANEEAAAKDMRGEAKAYPVFEYLIALRGIGEHTAAKIIAEIDISRSETPSGLWRFAGLGVKDGERERLVKGEKSHYNRRLKTVMFLVGESFIKTKSPYARLYYEKKAYYETNRPDWTKLHRHYAAMRFMVKIFLAHLWVVWRGLEKFPLRKPYVEEYLGHKDMYQPNEFGWEWQ